MECRECRSLSAPDRLMVAESNSCRDNAAEIVNAHRCEERGLLTFICFGARIGIQTKVPGLLARISEHLPPGATVERLAQPDLCYEIREVGGERLQLLKGQEIAATCVGADAMVTALASMLHFGVAQHAREVLFVHAGVVGWQGHAIVIPGRTMSGKTSLVAALVNAGADYLSDEYAVLDVDGLVHPYQKPLSIRDSTGIGKPVRAEDLGGRIAVNAFSLGTIVHTKYEREQAWQPHVLSAGQAMMALLENTVMVRESPKRAMEILGRSVRDVLAFAGPRGEAEQIVHHLLHAL